MYRSVRLFQARPLALAAFQATTRPALIASRRALSTSTTMRAGDKSAGIGGKEAAKDQKYVEQQNYTPGVKEELRGLKQGVSSIVSGASGIPEKDDAAAAIRRGSEVSSHLHKDDFRTDVHQFAEGVVKAVPKPAMVFGLAGTLPYLGTSVGTIFLAREASRVSLGESSITGLDFDTLLNNLNLVEHIQITYGAVILSFLGAIHWGLEFAKYGGSTGYTRLALGVIPALFAWPTTLISHDLALVAQWFGFTGTWLIDQRASTRGWTPSWYSTYRFYLSLVVGFSIIATFAGTNYYGAGAGAGADPSAKRLSGMQRINKVAEKNDQHRYPGKIEATTTGEIEVEEGSDSYLVLHDRKAEKEAAQEAEEERRKEDEEKKDKQKQKEARQDELDEHQQDKAPGAMKSDAKNRTGNNANEEKKEK